jgi:hypothetical protein
VRKGDDTTVSGRNLGMLQKVKNSRNEFEFFGDSGDREFGANINIGE